MVISVACKSRLFLRAGATCSLRALAASLQIVVDPRFELVEGEGRAACVFSPTGSPLRAASAPPPPGEGEERRDRCPIFNHMPSGGSKGTCNRLKSPAAPTAYPALRIGMGLAILSHPSHRGVTNGF